jgi:hypothetical protein
VSDSDPRPVVVLVGRATDAEALGLTARELEDAGARPAVFLGDLADASARAALHEMLGELFPH